MDSEYIEMNRALPREILDLWEPEVGDRILNKTALNYNKKKGREILDPVEFLSIEDFSAYDNRIKEWAIPLYRQEDLQAIYFRSRLVDDYNPFNFIEAFNYYLQNRIPKKWDEWIKRMDCLLLAFVMETCYGKQWDMETKKWVKI